MSHLLSPSIVLGSDTVGVRTSASGKWALKVRFSKAGEWRFRAIHQDSKHALGVSDWGRATVR